MAKRRSNGVIDFPFETSVFLILGTLAALVWANVAHESYEYLLHLPILEHSVFGTLHSDGTRSLDLHYLVNDILMAFFFAIVGKEVWEATFPGGPLSNARSAAVPLIAAVGGMIGPALIYLVGAQMIGQFDALSNGWAIPCATDIAFSYMVARLIFGAGHPAYLILTGLLFGKPLGIWLSGMAAAKGLKFGLLEGLSATDLLVVGFAAGIGFTVALFVATAAFPAGATQDAAKMGALASFAAAILTYVVAKLLGIKKAKTE